MLTFKYVFYAFVILKFVQAEQFTWQDVTYSNKNEIIYDRGRIVQYHNHDTQCQSFVMIPGIQILSDSQQGFLYLLVLIFLFLGLYIVMDILLEAIDFIISRQKIIRQKDPITRRMHEAKVKIWNPVIANLTLMVVGQSAPEMLLTLIESVRTINDPHSSQLIGPSTLVGSAAFNILVISAIAIYAPNKDNDNSEKKDMVVDRGIKRIFYLGQTIIITISNFVVYIWLFIALFILSPKEITFWESLVTIFLFIPLLVASYGYDKLREKKQNKVINIQSTQVQTAVGLEDSQSLPLNLSNNDMSMRNTLSPQPRTSKSRKTVVIKDNQMKMTQHIEKVMSYEAIDFYKILIAEKKGMPLRNYDEQRQRKEMKQILMKLCNTDDIEKVQYSELKQKVEGGSLLGRMQYRFQFATWLQIKKEIYNRYDEQIKHKQQSEEDDHTKDNKLFGFKCLNYSISESCRCLDLIILNKKKIQTIVGVRTLDGTASAGEDYEKLDKSIRFKKDQEEIIVQINIMDNELWEPDEEFFIELYDPRSGYSLKGKDTKCKVTILDDDNPGILSFEHQVVKVSTAAEEAIITVVRKSGCKGKISCKFKTVEIEDKYKQAIIGEDYEQTEGILVFEDSETSKDIRVKLLQHLSMDPDGNGMRFGLKIYEPMPKGTVKISMKDTCQIMLILDNELQIKQESLDQLLWSIEKQAVRSWSQQFKNACMLHPTLNLNGTIDDISNLEAFIHLITIGWKALFACIPPPHYCRGWPTLLISLILIGILMLLIGEVAKIFGCVTDIGTCMVGNAIVAVGVSLPDAIASWHAAIHSKYADNALTSLQCAVSTNIILGLGFSWFINCLKHRINGTVYTFNGIDDFRESVIGFFLCYLFYTLIMFIRRKFVTGELGGVRKVPKILTSLSLIIIWVLYLVEVGIKQQYRINEK